MISRYVDEDHTLDDVATAFARAGAPVLPETLAEAQAMGRAREAVFRERVAYFLWAMSNAPEAMREFDGGALARAMTKAAARAHS